MAALAPAVAAVRAAVRRGLADVSPGDTVLVACSGGADSLALAVAARFVTQRMRTHCGLVTVDHGLQAGSAERAAGSPAGPGTTSSTRWTCGRSRSAATAGRRRPPATPGMRRSSPPRRRTGRAVLLGHTRDDQAETVLLALTRGAGPHGLAGMPARRERQGVLFARPLLDVTRADTRTACEVAGLTPWEDPHNTDHAYARSRVRPLVAALGPAVIDNLARTAGLIAADTAPLDEFASDAFDKAPSVWTSSTSRQLDRLQPAGPHAGAALLGPPARGAPAVRSRTSRGRHGRTRHRLARARPGGAARRAAGRPPGRPAAPHRVRST